MHLAKARIRGLSSVARAVVIEALEARQLLAAGDPDLTFGGGDGFAAAAFSGLTTNHDNATAMAVQADGKIVLAGRSGNGTNTADRVAVARFNTDGTLDSSFDGDGLVTYTFADTDLAAVAIAPDGKIVIAGSTSLGTTQTWDWFIMRLNPDGSPDNSFGGGDAVVTRDFGFNFGDDAYAIAIQPDRKIVVTGVASQGTSNMATLRLLENGDLDPSFSGDGIDIVDYFGGVDYSSDVIIDPDGKIVVVGGSVPAGSYRRFVLLRYTSAGVLDPTFDGDGRAATDFGVTAFGRQILRDPAGNYVVAGLVGGTSGYMNYAMARYTSSGALDPSFGTNASLPGTTIIPNLTGFNFHKYGIARQADGKLLMGGPSESNANFDRFLALLRLTDTGAPDPTFGSGGFRTYNPPGYLTASNYGSDVAIASDGKILLAGDAYDGQTDFALFKLITEGSLPPPAVSLVGTVLTVTGTPGNDVLTLSADNTTFTAVLNGQTFTFPNASVTSINVDLGDGNDSETHITGVRGGTVNLGNGNDTLRVGTANRIGPDLNIAGGAGDDTVTLDVAFFTYTNFDGGGGNDIFTYNSGQGNDDLLITATQISDEGDYFGSYSNVERVNLFANFGYDNILVQSTNNATTYVLDGGDGNEIFTQLNSADPDGFLSPILYIGGPGTDEIRFDDSPNPYNDNYTITPTSFTRDFLATFNYQSTEILRVSGAGDSNVFNVTPSTTTSIFIDGNLPSTAPGDSINVSLAGATGTDFSLLGANRGRYTFSNRQPVEYQEVETDATAFGPLVRSGVFKYLTGQVISLQFSEDTVDITSSDLTIKNLTTNTIIPSTSFILTHTHGPGVATLAEWKPFSGSPLPDGNYEARLAAGSVRDTTGNLLANEFVFNFFVLTGDLNRDKQVTIADFITLASSFGKTGATYADGDVNYDQQVTIADFIDLASHFGQSLSGSADPIPMAAESQQITASSDDGTLFGKIRHRAKVKHHHKRIRPPRVERDVNLMFRHG